MCAMNYAASLALQGQRTLLLDGDAGAFLAYRNRVSEVQVPPLADLPDWWEGLSGRALPASLREESA